jgi:hypothetical protein
MTRGVYGRKAIDICGLDLVMSHTRLALTSEMGKTLAHYNKVTFVMKDARGSKKSDWIAFTTPQC